MKSQRTPSLPPPAAHRDQEVWRVETVRVRLVSMETSMLLPAEQKLRILPSVGRFWVCLSDSQVQTTKRAKGSLSPPDIFTISRLFLACLDIFYVFIIIASHWHFYCESASCCAMHVLTPTLPHWQTLYPNPGNERGVVEIGSEGRGKSWIN